MDNKKIFSEIYKKKMWTPENLKIKEDFYSGVGSHYPEFTDNYVKELGNFFSTFPEKPNVVDLGCGDFNIGSKLRNYCNNYIAADVCDEIIFRNKKKYLDLNVDFRVLDITKDEIPGGDIGIIRQVLQHLSNKSISDFLNNINKKFKYIVITEHYPKTTNFVSNVDITTGPDIRFSAESGVVLTVYPFNLITKKETVICKDYSKRISGFLNTSILELNNNP